MKFYKISTFALLAVVIVLSVIIYRHYKRQLHISDDLARKFHEELSDLDENHGDIINALYGKKKIDAYIDNVTSNALQNHSRSTYGYSFGLNKLKMFLSYIDTLKADIVGVRVYRAISKYPDSNERFFDAFMVPVKRDGTNYPAIDRDHDQPKENFDDTYILNTSSPCPNMCDSPDKFW